MLQYDNAKPHCIADYAKVATEGSKDGWNIQLCCQPHNSSDFNILDLGFSNAISTLQCQVAHTNVG